jgi:hypothetical protein
MDLDWRVRRRWGRHNYTAGWWWYDDTSWWRWRIDYTPARTVPVWTVQRRHGQFYVISTGGAAGVFTCGSDAGFTTFINRYNSSSLLGIDFDIEGGQSQDTINNLVQRVVAAERTFPNLRFSFTVATLGGNSPNSLNSWVPGSSRPSSSSDCRSTRST